MSFMHRTWAEIDLDALVHNFDIIKAAASPARIMAVVKADAYGHSARYIAPLLEEHGAAAFAVSNIEEAITLRGCGISRPILILGYTPVEMVRQIQTNDLIQTVFSKEYAIRLSEQAVNDGVTVNIHIKLDTGMSRLGFNCRSNELVGIDDAISAAKLPGLHFDGIFTHFAVSDRMADSDDGFTDAQYSRFSAACDIFCSAGLSPHITHCCNSAALCRDKDKLSDICRPGIILYGLTPAEGFEPHLPIIPVMTLKSVISMVKTIGAGDTVSYGRIFKAEKPMRIATVTAGYADGYPRLLSGKGEVIIRGKRAHIIGRICMDQFAVDVSDIPDAALGDEVELFGNGIPVEEIADICGTVNYEIVCGITQRVPRVAVRNGKVQ